jgi:CheY-like chemotaxis protein
MGNASRIECTLNHARMEIVIIDDEKDICNILALELTSMGPSVTTFENGQSALGSLRKESSDTILCDFQMPRISGLDLFSLL